MNIPVSDLLDLNKAETKFGILTQNLKVMLDFRYIKPGPLFFFVVVVVYCILVVKIFKTINKSV